MAPTQSIIPEKKLTPAQAILCGVVVGGIVIAALHYLVRENMRREIDSFATKIQKARTELTANQQLVNQAPLLRKQYQELGARLAELEKTQLVPEDNPVRWGNSLIEKLSAEQDMMVKSFNTSGVDRLGISRKTDKGVVIVPSAFEEFRTDIQLKGSYHQFGRFLARLETDLRGMRLDSLSLSGGGRNTKDRLLSISFKASFLRFSEEGFKASLRPNTEEFSNDNSAADHDS